MKHKAILTFAMVFAVLAYADCTTQTFLGESGIIKTCSTCCQAGQCTTVCF